MAHAWKACWVQALGGSNPPSSATGPRDRFRFRGFCRLWPRLISGRRESCPPASRPRRELRSARRLEARPVPAGLAAASNRARLVAVSGQAPPPPTGTAARPSGALHAGGTCVAWTSPARPCCQSHFIPGRRTLIAESTFNFVCNSLTALSNHEFRLLELQRFQALLKLLPIELHASFLRPGPAVTFRLRGQALRLEVCLVPPVSATPGVLRGVV